MSLNSNNLPTGGGGNIDPMEPGTYPARVACVIDLGMQTQNAYQGKEKPPVNMIAFTYEFVDEFLKDEEGENIEDKPRWLTEMMPMYGLGADKAKSTARYMALDPKIAYKGNFSHLAGEPCLVTVVHNPNKKTGGVYENIGGITSMRAKDADDTPPLVSGSKVFDMDTPDLDVFNSLPPFVQKKIMGGLEYEGSALYALVGNGNGAAKPADEEKLDDENPY
jgi:hypothetical protein